MPRQQRAPRKPTTSTLTIYPPVAPEVERLLRLLAGVYLRLAGEDGLLPTNTATPSTSPITASFSHPVLATVARPVASSTPSRRTQPSQRKGSAPHANVAQTSARKRRAIPATSDPSCPTR